MPSLRFFSELPLDPAFAPGVGFGVVEREYGGAMLRGRLRTALVVLLAVLALVPLVHVGTVTADILPTKGTFRGVYHVNRAGVGRLLFFIIPKKLKKRMAPYDGKYIEVEVLKGRQPLNPGPAIVEEIGKVTVLDPPPLRAEIRIISPGAGDRGTFDVFYDFRNVSRRPVEFDANDAAVGTMGYGKVDHPDEVERFFGLDYTRGAMAFGGQTRQRWSFISPMSPGKSNHFYARRIRLGPGEAVPFVWHGVKLDPGRYELQASTIWRPQKNAHIPIKAWRQFDVPLPKAAARLRAALTANATVTRDAEWLQVDACLTNATGEARQMFVRRRGEEVFPPGLVQLYDQDGSLMAARLDWHMPFHAPWVRTAVGDEGLRFRFRARKEDQFLTTPISRISFWTVSDAGLEKLTLVNNAPSPAPRALPPWGRTVKGCRCRIRAARDRFGRDERIRFFVQAESEGAQADTLWMNEGNFDSHVRVTIDGEKAAVYTTGVSDGHVYFFPFQGEFVMSHFLKLAPGRHKLRLSLKSDGGTYTNLRNEEFRKLDATLVSNEVEFEVTE